MPQNGIARWALASILTLSGVSGLAAQTATTTSVYVPARDGTRLAVDVHLPSDRRAGERLPALLELTRYWRAAVDPATGRPQRDLNRLDRFFLENGYAVVKIDMRGSGASFGTRPVEYGPPEVRDGYDIVEWVTNQSWSSGAVGAYGTSYTGTTAELLAGVGHPAVKAVIPGWSDFDVYVSPVRPYGLLATSFLSEWSQVVGWLDENNASRIGASVRPVDEDTDDILLAAAVREHARNPEVLAGVLAAEYRDQVIADGYTYDSSTSMHWKRGIEASGVPMLVFASWLDAGTADGALLRFQHYTNPQKLVILASSHGGGAHASPFVVGAEPRPPTPSVQTQFEMRVQFLDHYLKGADNGVDDWPAVQYFNLGAESLESTDTWPPPGATRRPWYLHDHGALQAAAPTGGRGADAYAVDYSVSTGTRNRWMTQMGNPVLNLNDRGAMDARMLVLRLAIAGADADTFDRIPANGTPTLTIHHNATHPSSLDLPLVTR